MKTAAAALFGLMTANGQDPVPPALQEVRSLSAEEVKSLEGCLKGVVDGRISPSFFGSHVIDKYGARSVPRLVAWIQSDGNTREACASALAQLAGRRGVLSKDAEKALIDVVKAGKEGSVQAAWALASICSVEGTDALLEAVQAPNRWVAQAACMALGMIGAERAREKLVMLEEAEAKLHPVVRSARKQALELIHELSGVDRRTAVINLLSRSEPFGYHCRGWAKSPAYVALRKSIEWNLKEVVPDLRQIVPKRAQEGGPAPDRSPLVCRTLYAIHKLGGELAAEEIDALHEGGFLRKQ